MFKGTIHFYKNVDGKEEEILKTFYKEKEFNDFIDKNLDIKKLNEFKWETTRWPSLSGFKNFYEEIKKGGDSHFIKDMEERLEKIEKEMKSLFDRSVRFLKK